MSQPGNMTYVALLRGINVGGNNKVSMSKLKESFESLGLNDVSTYINSGNVFFNSTDKPVDLVKKLEAVIERDFSLKIKVLLRDLKNITKVVKALPNTWVNDKTTKCDVIFLWEAIDSPVTLKQMTVKPGIDEAKYVPGAILWRVDKENVTRSGLMNTAKNNNYQLVTVRNCNTVRKIFLAMQKTAGHAAGK